MTTAPTTPTPTADSAPEQRAWLPLAAVATTLVFWASAFVAIRHLGADFSAGALSLGRLLVGALVLTALALGTTRGRLVRPTPREWGSIALIGALWFGIYDVALNEGETRVDAGTAAMLIQLSPVLIAVLAAAFLDERFSAALGLGLGLAFGGVALISIGTREASGADVLGVVLCLLAAVTYAISLTLQKPLVARLPSIQVTWLACTVGALVCLPFLPDLVREGADAPASSIGWVVYLGVFPTAVAFTTFAFALRHMSASDLGVTTYLVPPITILMGWALLGETPPALAYVGGALALLGVAVARRRPQPR